MVLIEINVEKKTNVKSTPKTVKRTSFECTKMNEHLRITDRRNDYGCYYDVFFFCFLQHFELFAFYCYKTYKIKLTLAFFFGVCLQMFCYAHAPYYCFI